MFFKLKKISVKNIFFPFVILFFIASALAQDIYDPLGLDMEEDITCEDLPKALMEYNQKIRLDRLAAKSTLSDLVSFLQQAAVNKEPTHTEREKMIEDIDAMIALINSNDLILLTKAENIHFSLEDCLKPSHSE